MKISTVLLFCSVTLSISSNCMAAARLKDKLPINELQRFTTVIEHIKNYYVTEVDDSELFENAIRGMIEHLDPHSAYLDEEEYADMQISTLGKFGGLGIEVTTEDGFIRVISPIDDTPAQKSGIKPKDLIIKINSESVKGMSIKKAVDLMRGKPGTKITLTIIREGENKPLEITLIRAMINVKSVKGKILEDDYAYVRISTFQSDSTSELISTIKSLKKELKNKEIKGLILDLRNNPGGVLEISAEIADTFLDKNTIGKNKLIVYTDGRQPSSKTEEKVTTGDLLKCIPIIVLVNGGSASASEIVAGALQDHKRALIVGTQTFGKGSVQTVIPLKNNRGLKITNSLYYTPNGKSIQAEGITPDIEIKDLEIPYKDQKQDLLSFSERDLKNHLENIKHTVETNKESSPDLLDKDKKETLPLIYTDYVLSQALMLLKGLVAFKN